MASQETRKAKVEDLHRLRLTSALATVLSGPDRGATLAIEPAGVTIGASDECDLSLDDKLVSRRHLELRAEEEGVRVLDLGSTNGTLFGGARVRDLVLTQNAVLTVGGTTLEIAITAEPLDVSVSPRSRFGTAVGESNAMRHVFSLLERAAKNDVTVLFEGESGTGKDVLATALHDQSKRAEGPFVVVDCGALPEGLLESELFGHEQGAFTGAATGRAGAFEQANGGTLFLDEIGELPLASQPKLLRAIETRSFRRLGGSRTIEVDVRVVAATNRRLREMVRHGEFREDLFYRLAVIHVRVPRLAERPEDVVPLATRFLRQTTGDDEATLPEDLARLLTSYAWPGNARELRNVIDRFATFDRADPRTLFGDVATGDSASDGFPDVTGLSYHDGKRVVVEAYHRRILPGAVEAAGGSVKLAAERLGLPRASLYRMLHQLEGDE
ncbi:MAG: sigma 54-interacting transcriptional regulator [Polyangiaceae bacterium]